MMTKTTARTLLAALALSAGALTLPVGVHAQVNPEIASCVELKDEATITQADLCSAHIGCRFVLNVQKTCAHAKSYLERLQAAIGEGTRTLLGYRKEVTPDAVFTAVLGADEMQKQRSLGGRSGVQKEAQEIASRVREVGNGDTLSGAHDRGTRQWVYYGQTSGGKEDGIGTRIYSDGEIQRGQTKSDNLTGSGEVLSKSGSRFVGKYSERGSGQRIGMEIERDGSWFNGTRSPGGQTNGTYTRADGTFFTGLRDPRGERVQGMEHGAGGSLIEEGHYVENTLSVGSRYDTAGVATTVNRPAEREAAAREAAEKNRLAAEVEQQRKREQAAQAEQQFRTSLQTMNAGQLFARADELNAQGDHTRAREVQRALMSRFPDHQLAAATARQIGGESGGSPAGGGGFSNTGASTRQAAFSKESSRYSSICMRNAAKAEQAINAAKARRYFGGAVDLEIFDMVKRISQPCMAYDSKAKWAYDDAEQARGITQCRPGSCSRWPQGETGEKTRQWFEIFSGEFNKMMANWEGYSSDLDPPGGSRQSQGAEANRSAAGRLSSQQCEAMRQKVIAAKAPPNASVTAATETVMFMTKTSMDMIDGRCSGVSAQDREEHLRAYLAAERACNQVQSGGRRCVPQVHAPSAPVGRPSVASSGGSSSTVSIDPTTGRCTPACARECRGLAGGEELCRGSSSGGSGGGIRTAR